MKNRVLNIIRSFSEPEVKKFREFLCSPYFNRSQKVYKLFNEIANFNLSSNYNSEEFNYKNLHCKVNPDIPFNATTMRCLISDLEKLALKYLKQQNLDNNEVNTHLYLRDELQKRSLNKFFEDSVDSLKSKLTGGEVIDESYFLNKVHIEVDVQNFTQITKSLSKRTNINSLIDNIVNGSKYLFLYYIMKTVKNYLNLISIQANYKEVDEKNSLRNFLEKLFESLDNEKLHAFLKDGEKDYHFIFDIYYKLFRAFSDNLDLNYYRKYQALLFEYSSLFTKDEKHFLFSKMIDFCTLRQRTNISDEFANEELVKLYELFLAKKYYQTEFSQYLPVVVFKNIVSFAINIKKYKWLEKFVQIYSNKLYPEFKTDLKSFALARISFAKGQMSDTLKCLNKINPEANNVKLDTKNLMIMTHFELGNHETLLSMIQSYQSFVKRSPLIAKDNKPYYKNFAYFTEKFVKFINNRNKSYIDELTHRIKNTQQLVYKKWLLEKAEALSASRPKAA